MNPSLGGLTAAVLAADIPENGKPQLVVVLLCLRPDPEVPYNPTPYVPC